MTKTVSGILIDKWCSMEMDEFNLISKEITNTQRVSLAKHFRKLYEVFEK